MTESTEDKVDKLYQDMYFGEGRDNPSMTTRMSIQEQKTESIERTMSKMVWLTAGTLLSAVGGLVMLIIDIIRAK
jgi:hypothetical protein